MSSRLLLLPMLALAVFLAFAGTLHLRQDLLFTKLDTELSFWGRANYQPTEITRAKTATAIERLLVASPGNASYLSLRASQLAWEGYWAGGDAGAGLDKQALAAQERAQQSRPAYGLGWLYLLQYAQNANAGADYEASAQERLNALQRWR